MLLTQLIMVFSSRNCPTEVSLWLLLDFCCLGIVLRSVVFVGVHVFLDLSVFLMVFVKEVFFLPYFLLCILDGLLSDLVESGVGYYWGNMFAGCLCYADDIVLLAPCQSALRIMLKICCDYASNHGLEFNSSKSQLICFRRSSRY